MGEYALTVVLDRVRSPADFIPYLKKIHAFLMKTSVLGSNFSEYYLQAGEPDTALETLIREAVQHKVPADFTDFLSMLSSLGEAPNDEENYYGLGLWNGHTDFLNAAAGDRINSFYVLVLLSAYDRGLISHDYEAVLRFYFFAGSKDEYEERKRLSEKIIEIAVNSLPFKYATFEPVDYWGTYGSTPPIVIGGSLYCIKSELNSVKGFRRPVSGNVDEISPICGFFDYRNPEHIQKAHKFEEELLQNRQFRRLLLR